MIHIESVRAARAKAVASFWDKVANKGPRSCWEWQGHRTEGYGVFVVNGVKYRAHRFSYELAKGPIQDGLVIDHICFNRGCVNPRHLRATTGADNASRKGPKRLPPAPIPPDVDVRQGIETPQAVQDRIRELAKAKLKPAHIAVEVRCSVQTVYKYAGDILADNKDASFKGAA